MARLHPLSLVVAFSVFAGSAAAFEFEMRVTGADELDGPLRTASLVADAKSREVTASDEVIAAVQSDYRTLLGALYKQGYYGPRISIKVDGREGTSLSLISLPARVNDVVISVDAGPKFAFGNVRVTPLAPETELPSGFATGQTAHAPMVGQAKDAAIEAWRDASHAKAQLAEQSIVADHPRKTLDVALDIAPGPSVTFGRLFAAGESVVSERRLRKIAGLPFGAQYSPEDVDLAARRLQRTGSFRSVSMSEADALNGDNSLDVTAKLVDETPRKFGFGVEISSLEGGTLSGYWLHRNLTKNADRLRVDAEISGLGGSTGTDYSLGFSYRRPATFNAKTTGLLAAEVSRVDDPNYLAMTGQFTFGVEVEASKLSEVRAALGYRYSEVTDAIGTRKFKHVVLPIEGVRDTRDNPLNPTHGAYLSADITPFIGVGGSASGVRFAGDFRGYREVTSKGRITLAGRLQFGSVVGADLAEIPPEYLFFSGGGGSVRGQPYQSLGVPLGSEITGGLGYVGLSGEVRAKVSDRIGVVGFYDTGGISDDAFLGGATQWHAGAGLGLRYDTGFGPIRVDVAAPVSGSTGDGVQIYVGIGHAF